MSIFIHFLDSNVVKIIIAKLLEMILQSGERVVSHGLYIFAVGTAFIFSAMSASWDCNDSCSLCLAQRNCFVLLKISRERFFRQLVLNTIGAHPIVTENPSKYAFRNGDDLYLGIPCRRCLIDSQFLMDCTLVIHETKHNQLWSFSSITRMWTLISSDRKCKQHRSSLMVHPDRIHVIFSLWVRSAIVGCNWIV